MDWFLDQWVYGTGIPKLKVRYSAQADGYRFVIDQSPETAFQMLVPVTFKYGGKKTSGGVLKVKPGRSEQVIPVKGRVREVLVDEHLEVLALIEVQD